VEISSAREFEAALDATVALWRRRAELLADADLVAGRDDVLAELENEYRGHITALAPLAEQHMPPLEGRLTKRPRAQLEVAVHVLLDSGAPRCHARLLELARDEASKRYFAVGDMLRYGQRAQIEALGAQLVAEAAPWLDKVIAMPLVRSGHDELVEPVIRRVLDGRVPASIHLLDAAAHLHRPALAGPLRGLMSRLDREADYPALCAAARCLYALGDAAGPGFYRAEIAAEDMHRHDMCWWYAQFAGDEGLAFLRQRLAKTGFAGWRERLLYALAIAGLIDDAPTLIANLDPVERDFRVAANLGLERIFGVVADEDPEDGGDALADWWRGWWTARAGDYQPGMRYFRGEPLAIQTLIARLSHPSESDRDRAHLDLRVFTGASLRFDPLGYVADRREAIAAWQNWLAQVGDDAFRPGYWWTRPEELAQRA
jgi:hypothetical protein